MKGEDASVGLTLGSAEHLHHPLTGLRHVELPGYPDVVLQAVGGKRIKITVIVIHNLPPLPVQLS